MMNDDTYSYVCYGLCYAFPSVEFLAPTTLPIFKPEHTIRPGLNLDPRYPPFSDQIDASGWMV